MQMWYNVRMANWRKQILHFDWVVLAALVALSLIIGILNNLRVHEERKVKWFGGPVVSAGAGEAVP